MTKLTAPQINELAEILSGHPMNRAPTKAKTISRFEEIAALLKIDGTAILKLPFEDAKGVCLESQGAETAPKSDMLERAAAVTGKGTGGPGLARLRAHKDYDAITQKTQAEAEGAVTGVNMLAKSKPKKPAPAEPKAVRSKILPTDIIQEVKENPKRQGTKAHTIYSCYKSNMTVAAFIRSVIKAGYSEAQARADLSWDRRKGFISIKEGTKE